MWNRRTSYSKISQSYAKITRWIAYFTLQRRIFNELTDFWVLLASSFGICHMMYSLNIIIICQKRRVSYIIYSLYYISYTRCILYIIYSLNIPTETYMGYVIQNMTSSLFSMMWVFCTYMYVSFPCEIDVQHTPKSVNPLSIRLCRERHAVRNMTFVFFQHDVGLVYKTSILYGKETYI